MKSAKRRVPFRTSGEGVFVQESGELFVERCHVSRSAEGVPTEVARHRGAQVDSAGAPAGESDFGHVAPAERLGKK